jgi:hypothetical protein
VDNGDAVTVDGAQTLLHSVRHTLRVWLSAGGCWSIASSGGDGDSRMKVEFSKGGGARAVEVMDGAGSGRKVLTSSFCTATETTAYGRCGSRQRDVGEGLWLTLHKKELSPSCGQIIGRHIQRFM